MTTCRPAGPIVHLTASASRSTPFFISRRAASSNMICLVAMGVNPCVLRRSFRLRREEETERQRDRETKRGSEPQINTDAHRLEEKSNALLFSLHIQSVPICAHLWPNSLLFVSQSLCITSCYPARNRAPRAHRPRTP